MSNGVKQIETYLASNGSYRQAVAELSWMIKKRINHSRIQRIVWDVGRVLDEVERQEREGVFSRGEAVAGGRVKAETLYAEIDGPWISLQRRNTTMSG